MTLNQIHSVYFIGIGGIGMSALARFFKERGAVVSGYDKTMTVLTEKLQGEGMDIHYEDNLALLNKQVDLVVYTPAIPSTHTELNWYLQNGYMVVKRSDVLQYISQSMQAICVAGTHGKTTMSTMIAHVLRHSDYGCNAFLGGISANYGVNYWYNENQTAVIEADEYDRSFLKLFPYIAVLSAMDADHLDIYGTVEEMEKCYLQFVSQVKDTLIYKHGLKHSRLFTAPHMLTYSSQNDAADYYAGDIVMQQGSYHLTAYRCGERLGEMDLPLGGMHNIENAMAAVAVADLLEISFEAIAKAFAVFVGVKRRFEYIIRNNHQVMIDDYAHHPEELRTLISSARSLFPQQKVSVIFQPHLYSRTRDLVDGFAASLDLADEVILMDIYPARELPIEGVTSAIIAEKMSISAVHILSREGVLQWVEVARPSLLITAGAGDIDTLVDPIKKILESAKS
jgi:UDP-N-acetylmuramate--alanine ligase